MCCVRVMFEHVIHVYCGHMCCCVMLEHVIECQHMHCVCEVGACYIVWTRVLLCDDGACYIVWTYVLLCVMLEHVMCGHMCCCV